MDFGTAFLIITMLAIAAAVGSLFVGRGSSPWESMGKGDLTFDESSRPPAPARGSAAARTESEAEVRQLLEAKSARRERRGEAPLDIDAELAALMRAGSSGQETPSPSSGGDQALREEVRQVVAARNERRIARGQEPLDVEAETDRQLRDLGG